MIELAGGAVEVLREAAWMLVHAGALLVVAHLAWAAGVLRRRPAVWVAIWSLVLIKSVLPWGPSVTGSLADVWTLVFSAAVTAHESVPGALVGTSASDPMAPWTAALWIGFLGLWSVVFLFRIATSIARLQRQRRQLMAAAAATATPSWLTTECSQLAARMNVVTPVVLVLAAPVVPHLLYGLRGSLLVVPSSLLADRELVRLALAHELAHLRRRDPWLRWLLAAVSSWWFFLPIRRLVGLRLERSQEAAADALAVRCLAIAAPRYAAGLVSIAKRFPRASVAVDAIALARPGALLDRVEALCVLRSYPSTGWLGAAFATGFAVIGLGQPRAIDSSTEAPPCEYSPQLAEALREVHPEADRNGDGELGRDEACALQEQLRRSAREGLQAGDEVAEFSGPGTSAAAPLWRRLCCDCSAAAEVGAGEDAALHPSHAGACEPE